MKTTDSLKWQLGVLALAALAACGGQDGPSSTGSSLSTKAATDQGSSNVSASTGGASTGEGTGTTATDAKADETAAPAPTVAPLSDKGVRGDVLATALRLGVGTDKDPITLTYSRLYSSGTYGPRSVPVQMVLHATRDHARTGLGRYLHQSRSFVSAIAEDGSHRDFNDLSITFGMDPRRSRTDFKDGIMLRFGDKAIWKRRNPNDASKNMDFILQGKAGFAIRRDDLFPMTATPFYTWEYQDEQRKRRIQASLLIDDINLNDNSFVLCMTSLHGVGVSLVQPLYKRERSTCTRWQVPSHWQPGGHRDPIRNNGSHPLKALSHSVTVTYFDPVMHDYSPTPVDYAVSYTQWRFPADSTPGN